MTKEELIEILKQVLKTQADLDFPLKSGESESERNS